MRFDCIHCRKATTKPQSVKGAFLRMLTLQIGEWLKVNGEGIYNTRPWKKNCQWSEGKRDWKSGEKYYVSGNAILKQTVNPEPGYATQEVFFTCKANNLYAILTNYPDKITLKDVKSTSHTIINLLGYPDKLRWEQKGQNLKVILENFC